MRIRGNMAEDKKSIINMVPDSVDNAVKNMTNDLTTSIGTTLADLWFLVFGGISHMADKRRAHYLSELKKFENELSHNISEIPEGKKAEPDIQVIAHTLEAAKYCVEKEELRYMFAKLIKSSLDMDYSEFVHPSYCEIIRQMSPLDARIFNMIMTINIRPIISIKIQDTDGGLYPFCDNCSWITEYTPTQCRRAFDSLSRLGLINIDRQIPYTNKALYDTVRGNPHFIAAQYECMQK